MAEYRTYRYTYTHEEWSLPIFRMKALDECRTIAHNNRPSKVTILVRDGRAKPRVVAEIIAK